MKEKYYIAISLIIVVALSFTGCETNDVGKDLYKETEINLPAEIDRITDVSIDENGGWSIVGANDKESILNVWETMDEGDTWKLKEEYGEKLPIDVEKEMAISGYFGKTGDFIVTIDYMDIGEFKLYIFKDGNFRELKLDEETKDTLVSIYDVNSNYFIADTTLGEALVINKSTGQTIGKNIFDSNYPNIQVFEDSIYTLSEEGVEAYSIEENGEVDKSKKLENLKIDNFISSDETLFSVSENDELVEFYYGNPEGLWKVNEGESIKLISGEKSSLGDETKFLGWGKFLIDGENIVMPLDSTSGANLYKYVKNTDDTEGVELEAYTLVENQNVEQILKAYERKYPNVSIKLTIGNPEYELTDTEAIKKLNTELLSGEGPDIIFLDGINSSKYIEENILKDLSNVISFDEGRYFELANIYNHKGGIYAIPMGFSFMVAMGDDDFIEMNGDFSKWNNELKSQEGILPENSMNSIASICYRTYLEPQIVGKENVDEKMLESFYLNLEKLNNSYPYKEGEDFVDFSTSNLEPINYTYFLEIANGKSSFALDYITSSEDLQGLKTLENFEILGMDEELIYIPRTIVAINENSTEVKEVENFIEYAVSEEGQIKIADYGALPINKMAFEKSLASKGTVHSKTPEGTLKLEPFTEGEIEVFMNMAEKMKAPATGDDIMMNIIMSNAEDYLNGDKTLKEAVNTAKEKTELYMSE